MNYVFFGIDRWSDEHLTREYHQKLQSLLKKCNDGYRDGKESILEDCVYDRLYKLCETLDIIYLDNIDSQSPTLHIGKKI